MAIDNFEARIAAAHAKRFGNTGPDKVETGTEVQRTVIGGRNNDGTVNANIPSALSREDEIISRRDARTMHGPKVTELRMPDTSVVPRNDGTALALGDLILFPSNTGGWGAKDVVSVVLPDGTIERIPEKVLALIYDELAAGNKPTLASKDDK